MNYFRACKEYKKLNKRTKSAFFQNIYSQLDEINETNPKLFWKTIDKIKKCGKTPQQNPIKKDEWENHLKTLFKKMKQYLTLNLTLKLIHISKS